VQYRLMTLTVVLLVAVARAVADPPAATAVAPPQATFDVDVAGPDLFTFEGKRYSTSDLCRVLEARFNEAKPALVRVHGATNLGGFFMPTVLSTWYGFKLVLVNGSKESAVTVTQQTDNFKAPPDCSAINIHAKIHVDD